MIVGAAGWQNAGDDLLAEELRDYVADNGHRARLVGGPKVRAIDKANGLEMGGSIRERFALVRAIARSRGVLIGGGGLLDDRRALFYRPFTRAAAVARVLRVPYAFVGVGVGPIRSARTARNYRCAVRGARRTLVRDQESAERLIEIGCAAADIEVVGDPVTWRAIKSSSRRTYEWAVNLREWEPPSRDEGFMFDAERVTENIARCLAEVVDENDRVVLVSMSELKGDDDRVALERLRVAAGHPEWPIVSGLDVASRTLEDSRNVLSMRLHGCLIAARSGARVLGLAYEPKVTQQARRVGFVSLSVEDAAQAVSLREAIASMTEAQDSAGSSPEWPL
ncbi:polysaccharide pyruvyl transferase family protein [Curtobacterium sp. Csp1]|uniref:polysaccharide pyruvyl transferase family protein n=1 Tax=Curtobacterium sp. Csp1 TaxID=2495429 RepID=UPI00159AF06C|nr:polysaccharide pyruvyl transferase family protein [Curtobacterium sp. Csp1]QKS20056.1 polysaccharide pyruvyl transferase family protein [Curtobacterium sp. Csp1]